MQLSETQQEFIEAVTEGHNIYLFGIAGSGKSHVIKHLVTTLPATTTGLCSMTGITALNIGGSTLHRWAGIGLGNGSVASILRRLSRQGFTNIQKCEVLIIDEISMCSAELFELIDGVARNIRCVDKPFGGIQLILCGDFYQLPPVSKKIKPDDPDVQMIFESELFKECIAKKIELTTLFRQTDPKLITLLNSIRTNKITRETLETLEFLKRPLDISDGILPTKLYCKNISADIENNVELMKLKQPIHTYDAIDKGQSPWVSQLDTHCIAQSQVKLALGAQVMLLKNDQENSRLVNEFTEPIDNEKPLPVVKFASGDTKLIGYSKWSVEDKSGKELASRNQIPLKLAYSITIHKSQGLSIDKLEIKIDDSFSYGQSYVALSRATNFEGLCVIDYDIRNFRINPKVKQFYSNIGGLATPNPL